jgi:hypothetical protein
VRVQSPSLSLACWRSHPLAQPVSSSLTQTHSQLVSSPPTHIHPHTHSLSPSLHPPIHTHTLSHLSQPVSSLTHT